MSFGPPQRLRTTSTTRLTGKGRTTPAPTIKGKGGLEGIVRTPSREAVQQQIGRYVRDIHRRQPPSNPHVQHSFLVNKKRAIGNSNTVSTPYTGANKGYIGTLGQHGVGKHAREEYMTDSLPTAVLVNEAPTYSDTTQILADDADDERVSNPYIQIVLRSAEQRWIPPSLSESPFDYKSRSQSLQQYTEKRASYLTRRELLREWKKKMQRSLDYDEKRMLWHLGSANDDKEKDQESDTETKSSLPLGNMNKKDQSNKLSGQTGLASTLLDPMSSKKTNTVDVLNDDKSSLKPRDLKHRLNDLQKLNLEKSDFSARDGDHFEDPRAYLYASSAASNSLNNVQSKTFFIRTTPVAIASVSSQNKPTSSFYFSPRSGVRCSGLRLEYCGGTVVTAPDNRELRCQHAEISMNSPFFASLCNDNVNDTVANYLISKEAELEDACGTIWVVKAHQAKNTIYTKGNNTMPITAATLENPQEKVFSQLMKGFHERLRCERKQEENHSLGPI
ncbi:hypothetical protein LSM04_002013 [Trypanosoma melophagium]|uniref:uncharacterized protein n=1 Tax=Trypanosoma melophagium TaxID=715481 RepID=UPI00351A762B|nr:hypothetical protein LSM04_002013 [Trypanosoma melophagium]